MPEQKELIQILHHELGIELPEMVSLEELKQKLSQYTDHLIQTDFQKLVTLLYRVDVSEPALKNLLTENAGTDAGLLIAGLIIERQLRKIQSRKETKSKNQIPDDEKW